MPKKAMSVHEAEKIAAQIAEVQNVELIGVELNREPTGYFLRFYVDTQDGVTLNQLEAFHRAVQPLMEDVAYDYMEVSSPGADRPLKTKRDFERAEGFEVELKTYRPIGGAKLFRGGLIGLREGKILLENEAGETMEFEQKDVAVVKPVIEFTEEDLQDDAPADPGNRE